MLPTGKSCRAGGGLHGRAPFALAGWKPALLKAAVCVPVRRASGLPIFGAQKGQSSIGERSSPLARLLPAQFAGPVSQFAIQHHFHLRPPGHRWIGTALHEHGRQACSRSGRAAHPGGPNASPRDAADCGADPCARIYRFGISAAIAG